jgi:hypothetical protein
MNRALNEIFSIFIQFFDWPTEIIEKDSFRIAG